MVKTANEVAEPVTNNQTAADAAAENDGFVEIQTNRYMYNVDECKGAALVGYLLAIVAMQPIDGRPWSAFLIRTTKPTLGVADETVHEVPVDSDVLIPATHELVQFLRKAATHPTGVFEVKIEPKVKISVGKSRNMWTYKLGSKTTPVNRKQFGVVALVDQNTTRQLTQAVDANWEDSPIPF